MAYLRFAVRSMLRTPGFSLLVVLCLALGIGVNVAFLGVLDVLLLRPPAGVRAAASLYRVESARDPVPGQRIFFGMQLSRGDVARLAARREVFAQVTGFTTANDLSLGTGAGAREVDGAVVDAAYFGVVGARALLGRLLGAADAAPDAPRTAVLSERLWRAAFGADSAIVGRPTRINGADVTVVGVAGDAFTGVEAAAVELWLSPSAVDLTGWPRDFSQSDDTRWLSVLARLAPGVSPVRATAVATTVMRAAPPPPNSHGEDAPRRAELSAVTQRFGGLRSNSPVPAWLLGATAAVLLVACANVANLLLARGEARRREIATRVALGASRGALVRQLLAESALLALAGGVGGLVLAQLGTRAFALVPSMPPVGAMLDGRVTLATLGVVALTTVLCGLVPALRGSRVLDAPASLRAGARATTSRSRLRGTLMVMQLAAALALLATAGVFVRSLRKLHTVNTGFDLAHVISVQVNLAHAGIALTERGAFAERALERVRALPRVAAAARAFGAPLTRTLTVEQIGVDGVTLPSVMPGGMQFVVAAGDDYFDAMGQRLVRGRDFTPDERRTRESPALIVSEAFARAAWGSGDPIGRCVRRDETACVRVVGVAADGAFMSVRDSATVLAYQPLGGGEDPATLALVVRARGDDVAAVAREVRAALQGMDPRMPYVGAWPLAASPGVDSELAPFRLAAGAFTLFGALALLVAAIGLYAVVAYSVARRTSEIGVRVALGATARNIRQLVLGEGARHAVLGALLGLAAGGAATYALRSKLYGVQPLDVPTFVVVTALLVAIALLASWLPARRAAAIPPTEALRSE